MLLRVIKYAIIFVLANNILIIKSIRVNSSVRNIDVGKYKNITVNRLFQEDKERHDTVNLAPKNKTVKSWFGRRVNVNKNNKVQNNVTSTTESGPVVKKSQTMITPQHVQKWAEEISEQLYEKEKLIVRRDSLIKEFSDVKIGTRNGFAIVEKAAKALEVLLENRIKAAEKVMRKAEALAEEKLPLPEGYTYADSVELDQIKPELTTPPPLVLEIPMTCRSLDRVNVQRSSHFDADVSLETSSVYVTQEVFPCEEKVTRPLYWSEGLLPTFRENYAEDATMSFQYFCSASGFLRHYPAAVWSSMYKVKLPEDDDPYADVYDCRLRSWYVSGRGAPRDVLVLVDSSGSMNTSANTITAQKFTLALLSALSDDDQVNVMPFNVNLKTAIDCLSDKLVPANHVNSAAFLTAMKEYNYKNETKMDVVLENAVRLLQKQKDIPGRPESCQQAIVLLTDELYDNYTEFLRHLDPEGRIRVFVLWLHDINGLRDETGRLGEWAACSRDGHYAQLSTSQDDPSHADVTEKVLQILQVLERPLVAQRRDRLQAFSDLYAHIEDPRRGEEFWSLKENEEQGFRYKELRKNKEKLLSSDRLMKDYLYQKELDDFGYYYEGTDTNYRLQISVSVPVFDYTTTEDITIKLAEEKQRNATRTYPVNRLLGVAGVDIPVDDLKLILPYSELGGGGYLFVIDHRGNVIIHDNFKPIFDGNILKPGYRTVDFLDLEQHADGHYSRPRDYPPEWLTFRQQLLIDQQKGTKTMYSKNIIEDGMRAMRESQDYYWKRVMDHYTVVVVLPKYGRSHAVPDQLFTQKLAEVAYKALAGTAFSVHPDWLYCRHVEPYFDRREAEVLHFIRRRRDESNFPMKNLKHFFSPIPPTIFEKTYQCEAALMARLCEAARRTERWAREHEAREREGACATCQLGSVTAFVITESGLTRWQAYHATTSYAEPPDGAEWRLGPAEPLYRRAVAAPGTLVVHAPLAPVRRMRRSFELPPPLGTKYKWLTAARTLNVGSAVVGVAGYHFYPQHFEDLLKSITDFPCPEGDEECEPSCDDENWSCFVIDEAGWVVGGGDDTRDEAATPGDDVTRHLAALRPAAMAALLNATVFKLLWLHDYQGVCFPPVDENPSAGVQLLPSLIKGLMKTVNLLVHVMVESVRAITLLCLVSQAGSETEKEKEKRRRHLFLTNAREKFEQLHDDRVLVNRTRIQACDRSRPLYEFQNTPLSLELLKRPAHPCEWPLVGAPVPRTNLLLVAVYNPCPHLGRPVPNPLNNEQIKMTDDVSRLKYSSSRTACWRNKVPLTARPPNLKCYPHDYKQEEGYRQCGDWIADEDKIQAQGLKGESNRPAASWLMISVLALFRQSSNGLLFMREIN